jgi:Cft2 family RNA processing exonuclease
VKLKFLGAAKSVTGSKHIIESNGSKILVDCGLFQGRREESNRRNRNFPFDPKEIERVVLSHAHIDHSGNLPNLVKQGYGNSIYSTFATRDLCLAMLNDSAYIQEKDAEYLNKKNERMNRPLVEPLYGIDDVERALSQFRGISYNKGFYVSAHIKLTFHDAGHILGSALLVFEIKENGKNYRLGYIVDLGRKNLGQRDRFHDHRKHLWQPSTPGDVKDRRKTRPGSKRDGTGRRENHHTCFLFGPHPGVGLLSEQTANPKKDSPNQNIRGQPALGKRD